MALDRQSIVRKDFPVSRRGYDPEAVDAHLATLADEISDYQQSARGRSDTLASSASDQVRAIVEVAENSAANIQREAETEAREIRDAANSEAHDTREHAAEQAQEYVSKVSEATSNMLQRLDAMENELTALIESLRTGGNRLNADLQLLESNLSGVAVAAVPHARLERESNLEPEFEETAVQPEAVIEVEEVVVAIDEHPAEMEEERLAGAAAADEPAAGAADAEGARLIALNMALNGTPREATARYLSENFTLSDRDRLLDEVYASAEG